MELTDKEKARVAAFFAWCNAGKRGEEEMNRKEGKELIACAKLDHAPYFPSLPSLNYQQAARARLELTFMGKDEFEELKKEMEG